MQEGGRPDDVVEQRGDLPAFSRNRAGLILSLFARHRKAADPLAAPRCVASTMLSKLGLSLRARKRAIAEPANSRRACVAARLSTMKADEHGQDRCGAPAARRASRPPRPLRQPLAGPRRHRPRRRGGRRHRLPETGAERGGRQRSRGRRPGAALCFARRAEAGCRPRPLRLRPGGRDRARHRRLDRRLHAVLLERGAAACSPSMSAMGRWTPHLAADPRVTSIEGLNARDLTARHLGGARPDFLVCDVSFISLTLALPPALGLAAPGARAVAARQAAIRGRPRGDRQGRAAEATRPTASAIARGPARLAGRLARLARARPHCPRRSRAATAIANFCWPGSRTGDRPLRRSAARRTGRRHRRDRARAGLRPFALPGEVVTAARDRRPRRADLDPRPLPQRVEPACRHFGICGGCALQHFETGAYLGWKREKVVQALQGRGVPAEVGGIVASPPHTRRRVVLSARRTAAGMLLGYNRALSHTIFDVEECPIALPEIVAALERDAAARRACPRHVRAPSA